VARNGRRVLFVVIDGRQTPYSDGTSLRETATILLALGARDALNLDGGGSSTMVLSTPAANNSTMLRIANRPSDTVGERPVGDALAISTVCSK
jgi:exopolysaccharide biosynthesis protein